MSLDPHQAMWPQMIATLAAIDAALGIPEDGCNSPAQTLAKIKNLRAAEAKCNSYIVDNARLAEENERLRAALRALANAADDVGVNHFDGDWLSEEVQAMRDATQAARALGA